jgi:hypothetical protein
MRTLIRGSFGSALLFSLPLLAQSGAPAPSATLSAGPAEAPATITYSVQGSGSGRIKFTGTTILSEKHEMTGMMERVPLTFEASLDCVHGAGRDIAMSGFINSSSVPEYTGARVFLAVRGRLQANDPASGDQLAWGIYQPQSARWEASDAERANDRGASYRWFATDAERFDDRGRASLEFAPAR